MKPRWRSGSSEGGRASGRVEPRALLPRHGAVPRHVAPPQMLGARADPDARTPRDVVVHNPPLFQAEPSSAQIRAVPVKRDPHGASEAARSATQLVIGNLSLIHISEPTRLGMISYAVFCLK